MSELTVFCITWSKMDLNSIYKYLDADISFQKCCALFLQVSLVLIENQVSAQFLTI